MYVTGQKDAGYDVAWQAAITKYRAHLVPLVRYPERVHGANAAKLSLWCRPTNRHSPTARVSPPMCQSPT